MPAKVLHKAMAVFRKVMEKKCATFDFLALLSTKYVFFFFLIFLCIARLLLYKKLILLSNFLFKMPGPLDIVQLVQSLCGKNL